MPFFVSRKKFESEVSKRAAEACEQVMAQMGIELHDELHVKFSVLRALIEKIKQSSTDPVGVKSLAIQADSHYLLCDSVLKKITRRLIPARLESYNFVSLLKKLCADMQRPGLGFIHFTTEGEAVPVDQPVEMHILRIVQELIQNAFKHSAAWNICVRLRWEPKKLCIEVEDDGRGATRIQEFIDRLRKKNNTLKMRTQAMGATIDYAEGEKGLLVTVTLRTK